MLRVLWPQIRWPDGCEPELSGLGDGIRAEFVQRFADVTEEQWRQCDGIVGPPPPLEYLPKLDKCRIYVKPAVGYDEVPLQAWGELGIPVCNTPDYGTREVADHAMALMLTLTKSIAFHDQSLRQDPRGNWRPALNPFGQRLADCTFGIVGLGRIGTAAALRAKAFDMDVVFYDPYKPNGSELALGIRRADSLEDLLAQADIVSIHTPLNDETRNLIDAGALAAAKRGIIVINTARGPIVDIDALHDALRDGTVLAAGLDVLPDEPANLDKPLIAAWHGDADWLRHRLVITPHSAFFTPQSMRDIRSFSARTAARYLRDGRLDNCVNEAVLVNRR
ncbi:MAG: C-terminal binding protein [Pseudomonadales bacterium]